METIQDICATAGTRAQISWIVSRGTSSSWQSSSVSASAVRGPLSASLTSPRTPRGWMIVSVSSPRPRSGPRL
jgi:hypothetical protein